MRLGLFRPKESPFFGLLRSGSENVRRGSQLLVGLLDNYQDVEGQWRAIKEVEEIGDHVIHEIMRNLHRTFVTPLDREDIAALGERIDDIIDAIEEGARYLVEYGIPAPTQQARDLACVLDQGANVLVEAVPLVRFRGKKLRDVLPYTVELHRLENEADLITSKAIAELFAHETSAITVIKWRDIYTQFEVAADRMEDVAKVLEGIVLKNA